MSSGARQTTTVGEIVNLMSVDTQKIQDACNELQVRAPRTSGSAGSGAAREERLPVDALWGCVVTVEEVGVHWCVAEVDPWFWGCDGHHRPYTTHRTHT